MPRYAMLSGNTSERGSCVRNRERPGHAGRSRKGVRHEFGEKRLRRHADEFAGRHDAKSPATVGRTDGVQIHRKRSLHVGNPNRAS